jgi:hypothetical protein
MKKKKLSKLSLLKETVTKLNLIQKGKIVGGDNRPTYTDDGKESVSYEPGHL